MQGAEAREVAEENRNLAVIWDKSLFKYVYFLGVVDKINVSFRGTT